MSHIWLKIWSKLFCSTRRLRKSIGITSLDIGSNKLAHIIVFLLNYSDFNSPIYLSNAAGKPILQSVNARVPLRVVAKAQQSIN